MSKAYLHNDEEDECDEDVDLRMFPAVVVVIKLLGHALPAPRAVVKQSDQRLVLRELKGRHEMERLSERDYIDDRLTGELKVSFGSTSS